MGIRVIRPARGAGDLTLRGLEALHLSPLYKLDLRDGGQGELRQLVGRQSVLGYAPRFFQRGGAESAISTGFPARTPRTDRGGARREHVVRTVGNAGAAGGGATGCSEGGWARAGGHARGLGHCRRWCSAVSVWDGHVASVGRMRRHAASGRAERFCRPGVHSPGLPAVLVQGAVGTAPRGALPHHAFARTVLGMWPGQRVLWARSVRKGKGGRGRPRRLRVAARPVAGPRPSVLRAPLRPRSGRRSAKSLREGPRSRHEVARVTPSSSRKEGPERSERLEVLSRQQGRQRAGVGLPVETFGQRQAPFNRRMTLRPRYPRAARR